MRPHKNLVLGLGFFVCLCFDLFFSSMKYDLNVCCFSLWSQWFLSKEIYDVIVWH